MGADDSKRYERLVLNYIDQGIDKLCNAICLYFAVERTEPVSLSFSLTQYGFAIRADDHSADSEWTYWARATPLQITLDIHTWLGTLPQGERIRLIENFPPSHRTDEGELNGFQVKTDDLTLGPPTLTIIPAWF